MYSLVSSLGEQAKAVAAAPVPFIVALLLVGAVIWWLMRFRYQGVIDNKKATLEAIQARAKAKEATLELTIQSLRGEIAMLAERAKQETNLQPAVAGLERLAEKATIEVGELRQANNAVTHAITTRWHPAYAKHVSGPVFVPEDHEKPKT
jgi:hypothetical protein